MKQKSPRLSIPRYWILRLLAVPALVLFLAASLSTGASPLDGYLDPTFGEGGIATTDFNSGSSDEGHALVLQPDGKILMAGSTYSGTVSDFALARYNPDGTLDQSFGNSGKVRSGFTGSARANAIALQPDGKIVVAGGTGLSTVPGFSIARYNTDGSLDTGFGGIGLVVVPVGAPAQGGEAATVALQTDGKIVMGGSAIHPCGPSCTSLSHVLVRLSPDGSLDPTFGSAGIAMPPPVNDESINEISVLPDGRILTVGYANGSDFALARYTTDGSLDTTFGSGGMVVTDLGGTENAYSMLVLPDGNILAGGTSRTFQGWLCCRDFALAKYLPDGTLDSSFGNAGLVTTRLPGYGGTVFSLAMQGTRIIAAGEDYYCDRQACWKSSFALARYNPDGSLDTSFGTGGIVTTGGNGNRFSFGRSVIVQVDAKIVVGGTRWGTDYNFALARYTDVPPPTPTITPTPTVTLSPTITPSPTPRCTGERFSDVCPEDYFYIPVTYLSEHGAISGYADGTFRPFNYTTRGQLCKIVVLAEGWEIDTTGGPHFTDVPPDNPFYSFIETAYNRQIISGYADGTFRWGNNVTRAQLSKIVVLAEEWAIDTTGGPHFTDVPADDVFYGHIETAYNHGIISGYSCGTKCLEFRPGSNATRGQISKIVYLAITGP